MSSNWIVICATTVRIVHLVSAVPEIPSTVHVQAAVIAITSDMLGAPDATYYSILENKVRCPRIVGCREGYEEMSSLAWCRYHHTVSSLQFVPGNVLHLLRNFAGQACTNALARSSLTHSE